MNPGARFIATRIAPPPPEWKPKKVSIPHQYTHPSGGIVTTRISMPAVSMFIDLWVEEGKDIRT